MKKTKETKKYYYRDEIHDDFAALQFKPKNISEDYKYINNSKIYWFISMFLRFTIFYPILWPIAKIWSGTKVYNAKALKKLKKTGYFLYSNHTTTFDPINHAVLVNPRKYTAIIASIDALSVKGLGGLIHYLGAFPVPLSPKMYRNFHDCIEFHIKHNHKVLIYPEAHIWPYYSEIRPFRDVSFRYPCEMNAPLVVATTTFKKRKFRKTPKTIIHISEPMYPNSELKFKEQIKDLRDRAYNEMCDVVKKYGSYARYEYIKLED